MTAAGTVWLGLFVGEVLAKRALGARAIFWRAVRADFARPISDDPDRPLLERAVGVPLLGSARGALSLDATYCPHFLDRGERGVVFPRRALNDKPPLAASRRNPLAVIEPSGYAKTAATARRSGVSSPTSLRAGMWRDFSRPSAPLLCSFRGRNISTGRPQGRPVSHRFP